MPGAVGQAAMAQSEAAAVAAAEGRAAGAAEGKIAFDEQSSEGQPN